MVGKIFVEFVVSMSQLWIFYSCDLCSLVFLLGVHMVNDMGTSSAEDALRERVLPR